MVALSFPRVLFKYPSSEPFSLFRISNKKTAHLFTLSYRHFFFLPILFRYAGARLSSPSWILIPSRLEVKLPLLLARLQSFNAIQDKPSTLESIQTCRPLSTSLYCLRYSSPPCRSVVQELPGNPLPLTTLPGSQTQTSSLQQLLGVKQSWLTLKSLTPPSSSLY